MEFFLNDVLRPKLLNNLFSSCFFYKYRFLLPHTAHFDDSIDLPFLVFNTLEFTFSVLSFLYFKQYVFIMTSV